MWKRISIYSVANVKHENQRAPLHISFQMYSTEGNLRIRINKKYIQNKMQRVTKKKKDSYVYIDVISYT